MEAEPPSWSHTGRGGATTRSVHLKASQSGGQAQAAVGRLAPKLSGRVPKWALEKGPESWLGSRVLGGGRQGPALSSALSQSVVVEPW